MKILKRIIYTLLGLILTGAVAMVAVILYAEYSGRRFSPESTQELAEIDFSDGESRLVYDENGNIAELPGGTSGSAAASEDSHGTLTDWAESAFKSKDSDTTSEAADSSTTDTASSADTAAATDSSMNTTNTTSSVAGTTTESAKLPYVMDLGSALFHTEDCPYAANIAAENRSAMTTTREKIMNAGYAPCSNCNP